MRRCSMCDEYYDTDNQESVNIHKHPEPQSGKPRGDWFASGLDYEDWITQTKEGKEWADKYN